jgi:hypothetical protein
MGQPVGSGTTQVPTLATLPEPVLRVVKEVYGIASANLFLIGAPIAALAIIAVLFLEEKPLSTLSGDGRLPGGRRLKQLGFGAHHASGSRRPTQSCSQKLAE